jgi:uncharacterized protein (TIGR00159 family)
MLSSLERLMATIAQSFRIQDVLDIIIISSLIYVTLIWFKRTASRFVFAGIVLLGIVYIMARWFQLYMTSMLLQGFFAILLIAIVVIFQEEIRHFFERLATWGTLRKKKEEEDENYRPDIEIIVDSVAELAEKRIGALVVIQGKDPLERHLKGGYLLDGCLSQPLIESIFDTHSIGHDGGMIIDKGHVVKFGCHLPLSANASMTGKYGLRHTAALGLSEKTDALCIVVSEERGTISVAQNGKIDILYRPVDLAARLYEYYEQKFPLEKKSTFGDWIKKNTFQKIVAIGMAMLLWLAFGYQRDWVQRDYVLPVEYKNIPQGWYIDEPKVYEIKAVLTGSVQAFNLFNPTYLKVSIDLSDIIQGPQDIAIAKSMIRLPSSITFEKAKPAKIRIVAYKLYPKTVPVIVKTTGHIKFGIDLKNITVNPGALNILVPESMTNKNVEIDTETIDLSALEETTTLEPQLKIPQNVHFKDDSVPPVRVTFHIEKQR